MPRNVPLSVRVSDDDAAFLAKFEAPGANTPSEKLRAILSAARQRQEGARDFNGYARVVEDMLRPAHQRVRTVQREVGIRSHFVSKLYERMPELLAELVASAPEPGQDAEALRNFESTLADQMFALIEEILDMGLTSRSRTYDPDLIREKLPPLLEILDLLKISQDQQKEKDHG